MSGIVPALFFGWRFGVFVGFMGGFMEVYSLLYLFAYCLFAYWLIFQAVMHYIKEYGKIVIKMFGEMGYLFTFVFRKQI